MNQLVVKPEPGRKEPRLWVRRLVLWENPETIIREIRLRPGLNVIWSPDAADQRRKRGSANALGHGSGKTLLCRLLRYCLGEDRFADDNQRRRVASALKDGMVGAEVSVDGVLWSVLRPLGNRHKHYAVHEVELESLVSGDQPATGIAPFVEAVEMTLLTKPVAALVARGDNSRAWLLSLAWLSRDQECRFDHVLDWRSVASDSDSPARDLAKALHLAALRALIGAVVPAEFELQEQLGSDVGAGKKHERESDHRQWELSRLRSRLISETGVTQAAAPEGLMGVEVLRNAAKRMLAKVAGAGPTTDVANIDRLRSELDEARNRAGALRTKLGQLENGIPIRERLIVRTESLIPGLSAAIFAGENPVCPVCDVRIDCVLAEGCKILVRPVDLEELRRRHQHLQDELSSERKALQFEREEALRVRQDLGAIDDEVAQQDDIVRAAENARGSHNAAWFQAMRLIDETRLLETLIAESQLAQAGADDLDVRIKTKKEQLEVFRDAQSHVFEKLSTFFDAIIGRLVPGATGRVALDGKGLKLTVDLGGDRSTAAIDSLKVVAFDLAVMCMSIEGTVPVPAFLIHDSPREADLGLSVYHELFHVAKALEPDEGLPLFQYIVTTTTRPPHQIAKRPCLVETLRGTPAGERLLRRNL